jgi:hypothetical protein
MSSKKILVGLLKWTDIKGLIFHGFPVPATVGTSPEQIIQSRLKRSKRKIKGKGKGKEKRKRKSEKRKEKREKRKEKREKRKLKREKRKEKREKKNLVV